MVVAVVMKSGMLVGRGRLERGQVKHIECDLYRVGNGIVDSI